MKNNLSFGTLFWGGILVIATMSCSDIRELKDDLSDLDSRIAAMEEQMETFNANVEAISLLAQATTVNSVSFEDDVYTVILSDGKELTLTTGEAGVGSTPLVTVDDDGFWMVDFQDGNGPVYLEDGSGGRWCSTGDDAVVPVFSIDADGYWMLDYGDGPVHLHGPDGNKVPATSTDEVIDPIFENVEYDAAAGTLTVTLRADGRQLSLPVVPDFLLALSNAEGLQIFDYGQTKVYPVKSNGLGNVIISTPQGWSAVLEDASFSITAPLQTRSTPIADSDTDVIIVASSATGHYMTVSKVLVSLSDAEIDISPRASVALSGSTSSSLAFTISLEEATSYRYMLVKTREEAPSYDEVTENGTESTELHLVADGLEPRTGYTLYLVACNGDISSEELVTVKAETARPDYASYYEAYQGGSELEIGGVVVSRALNGDAVLLGAEDNVIRADGVYFVPDGVTAQITSDTGTRGTLIVIGDNPSSHGKMEFSGSVSRLALDPARGGSLILFNLDFDVATDSGQGQILFYPANESGGTLETVAFEDCGLDLGGLQGMSFTTDTRSESTKIRIERLVIEGCDINVGEGTRFGYFFQYRKHNEIGDFIFRDNVVWSPDAGNNARLLNGAQSASAGDFAIATPVERFEMEHNTWVNCKGSPMNYVRSVGRYVLRNNLFYGSITSYTPVIRYSETAELDGSPESGSVRDNIGYVVGGASVIWKAANPNEIAGIEEYEQIRNVSEDPFVEFDTSAGVFVTSEAYSAYGARR